MIFFFFFLSIFAFRGSFLMKNVPFLIFPGGFTPLNLFVRAKILKMIGGQSAQNILCLHTTMKQYKIQNKKSVRNIAKIQINFPVSQLNLIGYHHCIYCTYDLQQPHKKLLLLLCSVQIFSFRCLRCKIENTLEKIITLYEKLVKIKCLKRERFLFQKTMLQSVYISSTKNV